MFTSMLCLSAFTQPSKMLHGWCNSSSAVKFLSLASVYNDRVHGFYAAKSSPAY